MEVHYLEWTDYFGAKSWRYSSAKNRPRENAVVSVMNDQSSYAAKDLAPLTQTLTTSTGGSTTREIPGETIKGMIGFFKDSISQFQRINTI